MINEITKKVVKEVEQIVSEEFVCDVCGKRGNYKSSTCGYEKITYYRVSTGHCDWGNDSCDSVKNKDACCTDCLLKIFSEWINDSKCSDTAYIYINKERHTRKKEANNDK